MKTLIYSIICIVSISISGTSYSQSSESVRTLNESNDTINNIVIPSEKSYHYTDSKTNTYGVEISGSFYSSDYPWAKSYGVSLAIYPDRNRVWNRKNTGYSEYSPILHTYNEKQMDSRYSDSFLYYAPGISIYSRNRKVSLELFHTLNSQIIINGSQQTMPYKVNFRF